MRNTLPARLRSTIQEGFQRWNRQPVDFRWFIGAICIATVGGAIVDPAFNNYLRDTFHLAADRRGELEFPRELPGFLVALTSGLLFFLPEVRTGALATAATALGIAGLAWAGSNYGVMIFFMVLWSTGMHLMMPMRTSIILSFATQGRQATLLGLTGSITTVAAILGAAFGWWLFSTFTATQTTYNAAFLIGASIILIGVLMLLKMRVPEKSAQQPRPKLVVNSRYRIYYLMSLITGARKQVFITFAPWVLITVFHRGPSTFAALAIVGSLLGIVMQPWLGRLIDRFGERRILMTEGMVLLVVCMGYGFAHRISTGAQVLAIIYLCYILDQLLFSVGMARVTYVNKIARKPEDVTATLSLGVTLDHLISMSIPTLGGATWMLFGFEYVFVGAGVLALVSVFVASFVRVPHPQERVVELSPEPERTEPCLATERARTSAS